MALTHEFQRSRQELGGPDLRGSVTLRYPRDHSARLRTCFASDAQCARRWNLEGATTLSILALRT